MISIGIAINRTHVSTGAEPEPPIMRRDLLCESGEYLVQEENIGGNKLVYSFGTYDSLLTESANFLTQEDSGKFILTVY